MMDIREQWNIEESGERVFIGVGDKCIAQVYGNTAIGRKKRAALIAKAPELYWLLSNAVSYVPDGAFKKQIEEALAAAGASET